VSDSQRNYLIVDDTPQWVRTARMVHARADCGQTPAQAYERRYGRPMPFRNADVVACHESWYGRVPATRPDGVDDFRRLRRWSLHADGTIFYIDEVTAHLMETVVPVESIPESQHFTVRDLP
jgi:hypothetical protein